MDEAMDTSDKSSPSPGLADMQSESTTPELPSDGDIPGMKDLQAVAKERVAEYGNQGDQKLHVHDQGTERSPYNQPPSTCPGGQTQQVAPSTQAPHQPPPEFCYLDDRGQNQIPVSQHSQFPQRFANPQQFYRPYFDLHYQCWFYYDPQYNRRIPVPAPQQHGSQPQHYLINYPRNPGQSEETGHLTSTWKTQSSDGQHETQSSSQANTSPRMPGSADLQTPGIPPKDIPVGQHQSLSGSMYQQSQHLMSHFSSVPDEPPPPYSGEYTSTNPSSQPQLTLIKDQCEKEKDLGKHGPVVEAGRDFEKVKEEKSGPEDTSEEETLVEGIEVKGLPSGVSADTVSLYFENKRRSGGGPVKQVIIKGDGTALLYFADSGVIQRVLDKSSHKIQGNDLQLTRYNPGEQTVSDLVEKQPLESCTTVIVSGCCGLTDDILELYFENRKKSGGGEVNELRRLSEDEVVITFTQIEAYDQVLSQKVHKVQEKELKVSKYILKIPTALEQEADEEPADAIVVSGCSGLTDDILEMYFENVKKCGGGEVRSLSRTAVDEVVITFTDPEVADRVLTNTAHKVQDNVLHLSKYKPQKLSESTEEMPADTITVTGCTGISDDVLEMYFESNKKSGGSEVEELRRLSEDEVVIKFSDPEVTGNVLNKQPHNLGNKTVKVTMFKPKKGESVPLQDIEMDVDDEEHQLDTIAVRGFEGLTDDTVELYFENRRKSGGGDIDRTKFEDPDILLITFKNPEAVERVLKKDHNVGGHILEVTAYQPHREKRDKLKWNQSFEDNIDCEDDDEDDQQQEDDGSMYVLEVRGLKDNTSHETLSLYFENRRRSGGGEVEKVEVDVDSGTALVYFMEGNVVERVLQKIHHLEGRNLNVAAYLPPKKVQKGEDGKAWLRRYPEGTVLELHGFDQVQCDILQLYFENRKRSGGEVLDIRKMEDEDVIYLIYSSQEDAENVAKKKHVIEQKTLEVKVYKPPPPPTPRPKYSDRFLIRGMKETTAKETLLNFLLQKCKTECNKSSLTFGEEPGTVLVAAGKMSLSSTSYTPKPPQLTTYFGSDVSQGGSLCAGSFPAFSFGDELCLEDIKRLRKICEKHPLEGAFLEISTVPVSNCILVKGLNKTTTKDTVELYFEGKRSGNEIGAGVEKCELTEESGQALVYFDNYKVIQSILAKEHRIINSLVTVSLYTECLGETGGDSDPIWFKLPEPVVMGSLNRYKMTFIRESKLNYDTFQDQLKNDYATVTWKADDTLVLECMLRKEMKDSRKLIKTWKKNAVESAEHYMSMLICEEVKVLHSVWKDVSDKLPSLKMPKPDAGKVFVCDDICLIVVVGHTSVAGGLIEKVKNIVKTVEEEQERKKSEISETVKTMKPLILRYLLASGYQNDMMSMFQGLKVEIKLSKGEITFTGLLSDVKSAQIKMYENSNGLSTLSLSNMSPVQMQFVDKKEVRQYVVRKLKGKHMVGVWHVEKNEIFFMAKTDEDVKSVVDLVHQSVQEQRIDLDKESVPLLTSHEWIKLIEDLLQSRGEFLKIIPAADKAEIVVVATDDIIAGVAEDVNNFIREKTVYSETVQYPRGVQRFLTQYLDEKIRKISQNLNTYSVDILFQKSSLTFDIKGTKDGLQIAMAKLDELSDTVIHKSHLFDKPGVGKLILSERGNHYINMIENTERCIVEREFDDSKKKILGNQNTSLAKIATGGPQVMASYPLAGGRNLHVSQGDITQMNVDVIVNAANAQLAHIGGLARAIVEKGGQSIQKESQAIVQRNGDVMVGEVAVTKPGQLPCKIIVHAVGPIWSGRGSQEEELLREAIFNTLEETNIRKLQSVAIPALSTGIYRYPVSKATRVITEAIQTHFQDYPQSSVRDVFVCDNNIKTVNEFKIAVSEKIGKPQVLKQSSGQARYRTFTDETPKYHTPPPATHPRSSIQIKVVKGEIAKQTVDAIVNTTAGNLVLTNGAVSNSILAAAGQILQQECSMNYPNGISYGEVAVTSAGNLNCRNVFHTCLPSWAPKIGEKAVELLTEECLKVASQKRLTSIAFPALGTGQLGYPRSVVAKVMFDTINTFGLQKTSLQEARIVVYPSDSKTVQAFDQHSMTVVKGSGTSRKHRNFSSDHSTSSSSGTSGGSTHNSDWHTVTQADLETVFSAGKVQLTIKQGDITKERVNCIVNSTNSSLDLSQGAVARSILNAGGEELKRDCDLQRDDMVKNGVVVTRATGLPSDYIVHVNAHHFQDLKKVVLKCLKAAGKSRYVTSIAFPALGTGQGFATVEKISQQFVEALRDYQSGQASGSIITDIRMVIFQKTMLEPFIAGVTKTLKGTPKGYFRRFYDFVTGDGSSASKTDHEPLKIQVASDVMLHFFSDDEFHICNSIEKLETRYSDLLGDKKITDEDLKDLGGEQRQEIEDLAQRFSVKVDYHPRLGRVRLQGLNMDVSDASDALQKILRNASKREVEAEKADLLASILQWFYIETDSSGADQYMKYDPISNQKIEDAYKDNQPIARLVDTKGVAYIIDFRQNLEYLENDKSDALRVVRKDLIKSVSFEPPTTWTSMTKESEMIQLTPGLPEYSSVEQDFINGTGGNHHVLKIQRIQTKFLWQQYVAKKQQIDAQNPPGSTNERTLWHGTAPDAIPSICKDGFNRSYCGKNATYYGEGVYFAVNASYSAQGRYSPPDSLGQRYMFRAKVLTGTYTQGKQGLRVLPFRDTTRHIQYDSSVENTANPTMFVIFNDTQAYPEYLITFQ